MRYKGEVTFSLTNARGNRIILKKHNDAEIGLQIAFANMLSGISTGQWVPAYIEFNGLLYDITGRNKRISSNPKSQSDNPKYYVEFNTFIPVNEAGNTLSAMLSSSAKYFVCGVGYVNDRSNIYKLASISPDMDNTSVAEVSAAIGDSGDTAGLQLNINWKMYLEVNEQ